MNEMYVRKCAWCHQDVSIFESITGFGKHYHEDCNIHRLQFEIEAYKKKYINGRLTEGDKADLVDKYTLVQKLMSEHNEFKGWKMISEKRRSTPKIKEKLMICDNFGFPILDSAGEPQFKEVESSTCEIRYAITRPNINTTKRLPAPKNQITVEKILQIPEKKEERKPTPAGLLLEVGRNDQAWE